MLIPVQPLSEAVLATVPTPVLSAARRLAAVMSDAGLTNGAFYGHFTSKEDLVAVSPRSGRAVSAPEAEPYARWDQWLADGPESELHDHIKVTAAGHGMAGASAARRKPGVAGQVVAALRRSDTRAADRP